MAAARPEVLDFLLTRRSRPVKLLRAAGARTGTSSSPC